MRIVWCSFWKCKTQGVEIIFWIKRYLYTNIVLNRSKIDIHNYCSQLPQNYSSHIRLGSAVDSVCVHSIPVMTYVCTCHALVLYLIISTLLCVPLGLRNSTVQHYFYLPDVFCIFVLAKSYNSKIHKTIFKAFPQLVGSVFFSCLSSPQVLDFSTSTWEKHEKSRGCVSTNFCTLLHIRV